MVERTPKELQDRIEVEHLPDLVAAWRSANVTSSSPLIRC
jgi:hypothetical protein